MPRQWLNRLLHLPLPAIVLPALLSLTLSLIPFLSGHPPLPGVQDEFAHLLAADTFAHGRLTNPPPPLWPFFEAPHILLQPTYASKYLPAQGLTLALGQRLGSPIIGVYLTAAAACAAIAWMLLGCVSPPWALLGGCLAAAHPLLLWWSQTYWGGGVALLGGALLIGTAIRLANEFPYRQSWAWLGGIGGGVLLLSRPFEGGIVGILLSLALLTIGYRQRRVRHMLRPVPILSLVLLAAAAWLAYYNSRVTGSPWQLPYTLAAKQYMTAPLMYWQSPPTPPLYRSAYMAHFYRDYEWPEYAAQVEWNGFATMAVDKLRHLWPNFVGDWRVSALPLLLSLTQLRRNRAVQLSLLIVLSLPMIELACTPWMRNQYMAPAADGFLLLLLLGYRQLSRFRPWNLPLGAALTAVLLSISALQSLQIERSLMHPPDTAMGLVRQDLISQLNRAGPAKKLLFIRHQPNGSLSDFVYNTADIDSQPIVFARDLGDRLNQALIQHYPDRQPWLLLFETRDLEPYVATEHSIPR